MEKRINPYQQGSETLKILFTLSGAQEHSTIERPLLELIYYRVSQLNGCAYCLDMHSKDLRAAGETEQRLYMLDAWRDAGARIYTARERAAFAWAEAVTKLPGGQVSDEVYEGARQEFSEMEMVDLTMAVITINCYNRMNIAFRVPGGSYQPAASKPATT